MADEALLLWKRYKCKNLQLKRVKLSDNDDSMQFFFYKILKIKWNASATKVSSSVLDVKWWIFFRFSKLWFCEAW